MDLRKGLLALRFVGLRTALRAVRAAWARDRWERPWRRGTPAPWRGIGPLRAACPFPGGMRFSGEEVELEIRFLAPDGVQITWTPGRCSPPYARIHEVLEEAPVTVEETADGWRLASPALQVEVDRSGGLRFRDREGRIWREEEPPERAGPAWRHRVRLRPEEALYGLGERAAPLNRRGRIYRMWNRDPGGSYGPDADPLYLGLPVWLSLHEAGGYLVFYENPFESVFDLGATDPTAAQVTVTDGVLRYVLFPGPPDHVLRRYTALTGRPPLPPRWALGFHQSRWSYRSAEEVRAVVRGFQAHDLPLHAIHLDIDYMDGYRVFTVDRKRFPDLPGLIQELEGHGIRTVVILDPGVKVDPRYPVYRDGLRRGAFCRLPNGEIYHGLVWPGWCAFPDFSDPKVRAWWGEQYQPWVEMGVAGFWHDMNEPTVFVAWGEPTFPRTVCHALEGQGGDHREAHNVYGLLMNRAAWEALRALRPDRRPFLLSRSGWVGLARYAWHWTGDVESTWAALRRTIAIVLGLGLSGIPYTGSDIGGFSGAPSAELFVRWFQAAAFMPFFRNHAAKGTPRREPWAFGEPALSIVRSFLRLRVRLLPYLYTLAWEAAQTGHPLVRPLFWLDPADRALWEVEDAFLLGPAVLVAPVTTPGARSRPVQLPHGVWYDFWTDRRFPGPGTMAAEAPLERLPVFVRAGSVLPMATEEGLEVHLYAPVDGEGEGWIYTDAGEGFGPFRLERWAVTPAPDGLRVRRAVMGSLPEDGGPVRLWLHGFQATQAYVDGAVIAVHGSFAMLPPFQEAILEGNFNHD